MNTRLVPCSELLSSRRYKVVFSNSTRGVHKKEGTGKTFRRGEKMAKMGDFKNTLLPRKGKKRESGVRVSLPEDGEELGTLKTGEWNAGPRGHRPRKANRGGKPNIPGRGRGRQGGGKGKEKVR